MQRICGWGSGFAEDGAEDAALEMYLRAATAAIEARTGLALIARSVLLQVSAWALQDAQPVPMSPVLSVDEVALVDAGGARDLVPAGDLRASVGMRPPVICPQSGNALPTIPRDGFAELWLTVGHGGDANAVPADLRQAVLLLASAYYEARGRAEEMGAALPFGVLALLEPYRHIRI